MPPQLSFADCAELTGINASTALNALGRIDNMGVLDCAADCACGALSCTESTSLTLVIDAELDESLAAPYIGTWVQN